MALRSKVAVLPAEVRNELERRIVEKAFSGYQDLSEWLQAQGYHIAHDSIQRHGSRLRQRIEEMELLAEEAKALSAAAAQAGETMVDAAIQLIHQRVFSMLLEEPEHREGSSSAGVPACAPHLRRWVGRARTPRAQATRMAHFMTTAGAPRSEFAIWRG
jgi:hypothetical protein